MLCGASGTSAIRRWSSSPAASSALARLCTSALAPPSSGPPSTLGSAWTGLQPPRESGPSRSASSSANGAPRRTACARPASSTVSSANPCTSQGNWVTTRLRNRSTSGPAAATGRPSSAVSSPTRAGTSAETSVEVSPDSAVRVCALRAASTAAASAAPSRAAARPSACRVCGRSIGRSARLSSGWLSLCSAPRAASRSVRSPASRVWAQPSTCWESSAARLAAGSCRRAARRRCSNSSWLREPWSRPAATSRTGRAGSSGSSAGRGPGWLAIAASFKGWVCRSDSAAEVYVFPIPDLQASAT